MRKECFCIVKAWKKEEDWFGEFNAKEHIEIWKVVESKGVDKRMETKEEVRKKKERIKRIKEEFKSLKKKLREERELGKSVLNVEKGEL